MGIFDNIKGGLSRTSKLGQRTERSGTKVKTVKDITRKDIGDLLSSARRLHKPQPTATNKLESGRGSSHTANSPFAPNLKYAAIGIAGNDPRMLRKTKPSKPTPFGPNYSLPLTDFNKKFNLTDNHIVDMRGNKVIASNGTHDIMT